MRRSFVCGYFTTLVGLLAFPANANNFLLSVGLGTLVAAMVEAIAAAGCKQLQKWPTIRDGMIRDRRVRVRMDGSHAQPGTAFPAVRTTTDNDL
jgi:hypothetical protein